MTRKKMSGMKLSEFSGISNPTEPENPEVLSEKEPTKLEPPTVSPINETVAREKPVTINIKISRTQHEWLTDTARIVRDNNAEPVPSCDRVYSQHLIGVAIELLKATSINWSQIKNTQELKRTLNL